MPFTLAHPAIILPLTRIPKYFNPTALVIGSLAPDFEYFFRFEATSTISHSILGILVFNLPLVFLLSYIFHFVIKKPFLQHLPSPFDKYYSHYSQTTFSLNSFKKSLVFIISAIIGSASHVLWDNFTHIHGYFVELIPSLQNEVMSGWQLYKLLQHGSTIIGLVMVSLFCLSKRRVTTNFKPMATHAKQGYWINLITLTPPAVDHTQLPVK